ncbi:MAG: C2 family cysteine protease [Candidatus Sericytochromatia bacterium]
MKKIKNSIFLFSTLIFTFSCSSNNINQIDNQALIQSNHEDVLDPEDKVVSPPKTMNNSKSIYQEILNSWDTDKTDKGLTFSEIKSAVDTDNDSLITLEELNKANLNSENSQLVLNKIKNIKKNDSLVYKLVELDEKVFPDGITKVSEHDIQQGKRNVCYFLSGLAGLAYHRREKDILNLIEKNRDNTYTVTFPGISKNNKFTVPFPTDEDLNKLIYRGENGSAWVAIMVNAYHKYGASGGRPFKHAFAKKFVSDYGLTWEGIETQTGNRAESYLLDLYNNQKLINAVKKALNEKKVIEIDTFLKGNISTPLNPKKNQFKFSRAHILTVIGIDEQKQNLIIRDPYGEFEFYNDKGVAIVDKSTDGIMNIPINDLKKYFLDISIESDEKGFFKGTKNIFQRFF